MSKWTEDLKAKAVKVKDWTVGHKEHIMVIGLPIVAIGAAVVLSKKEKNTIEEIKGNLVAVEGGLSNDRFLYQLESQPECWMMIVGELNNNGEPTDLKEIGRQIAEGEFREE